MGGQNRPAPRCSVRKQALKSGLSACRKSKSQVSAEGEDYSVYAASAEGLGSPEAAEDQSVKSTKLFVRGVPQQSVTRTDGFLAMERAR